MGSTALTHTTTFALDPASKNKASSALHPGLAPHFLRNQNTELVSSLFAVPAHSGRLRYASAQDLPSFPSIGLKNDGAAASAAACLGWANAKPFQPWNPDSSAAASTAALLANNDGKMPAAGEPQSRSRRSTAGSQAAALAIGSAQQRRHPQSQSSPPLPPSPQSTWGNSAAVLAFNRASAAAAPPAAGDTPRIARQGSMHAAKGAMAGRRPRARSSPTPKESYPDQANAASNALSAATIAHRPSIRPTNIPLEEAGAVPYTTMDRQMFTSRPPVKPEVDEQRRNDVIHASAVAMAKKMYDQQQSVINTHSASAHARSSSFTRHGTDSVAGDDEQPPSFGNLQEAAYKLAQQRLANLQQEHQKNRSLEDYYASPTYQRHRLGGIRSKLTRRRSASDGALFEDKKSLQIRKQMSLFDTKLAEVDEQKRTRDREALLAAAHRNVQARLRDMDEKIQEETGWVAPTTRDDWHWKARATAQARFDASRLEDQRKVDVGGGKFMDRDAVEAIAAQRVQPLLDQINEKAEKERERKAKQKMEEDKQREEAEKERMREREIQENYKKLKDQQKDQERARKAEMKQEEKARKEDEKAARAEQKQLRRQKDKEAVPVVPVVPVTDKPVEEEQQQHSESTADTESPTANNNNNRRHSKALSINFTKRHARQKSKDLADKPPTSDGESAPSPANKVKTWLKTHFHRPRSHSTPVPTVEKDKKFIGGAALAKLTGRRDSSSPSVEDRRSASMREVALAGRERERTTERGDEPGEGSTGPTLGANLAGREDDSTSVDTRSVSSLSSLDNFEEARTTLSDVPVTPPRFVRAGPETGRASPARGSRFSEILE